MKSIILVFSLMLISFQTTATPSDFQYTKQTQSPIKLSRSGICHKPGSTYYNRVIHFISYPTLRSCLKVGRLPKR